MRLLHVIETLGRGGAEQALLNVLPALQARGHSCEVAVLWDPTDLGDAFATAGIVVHRLGVTHRWGGAPAGIARLTALCTSGRYDVLHAHLYFACLYAALVPRGRGPARRFVTFHNLAYEAHPVHGPWLHFRRWMESAAVRRRMTGTFAVSSAAAAHYAAELGINEPIVIPNALPPAALELPVERTDEAVPRPLGVQVRGPVLAIHGRLVTEKGHEHLLLALARLRERAIAPAALFIGDGPLETALAARVSELGLAAQVRMCGAMPQRDLLRTVRAADLCVVPSVSEGFGLVAAEALAMETPVIATRLGGLTDIVEDGVSGILVPPGDSAALAEAIARLLGDHSLRARMGRTGRERVVARFAPALIAEQLEQAYAAS